MRKLVSDGRWGNDTPIGLTWHAPFTTRARNQVHTRPSLHINFLIRYLLRLSNFDWSSYEFSWASYKLTSRYARVADPAARRPLSTLFSCVLHAVIAKSSLGHVFGGWPRGRGEASDAQPSHAAGVGRAAKIVLFVVHSRSRFFT